MKYLRDKVRKWIGLDETERLAASANREAYNAKQRVLEHIADLEHFTKLDVDAHYRGDCTVILTGAYRGRAYVQFYDLSPDHFARYVEMLKYEKRDNIIRTIDAPIGFKGHFSL